MKDYSDHMDNELPVPKNNRKDILVFLAIGLILVALIIGFAYAVLSLFI